MDTGALSFLTPDFVADFLATGLLATFLVALFLATDFVGDLTDSDAGFLGALLAIIQVTNSRLNAMECVLPFFF